MCLVAEQDNLLVKKIAETDIVAYKLMQSIGNRYNNKRRYFTGYLYKAVYDEEINGKVPYTAYNFERATDEKTGTAHFTQVNGVLPETAHKIGIECIHSFVFLEDAKNAMHKFNGSPDFYPTIFKVIIKAGTEYYEGFTGNNIKATNVKSYASKSVIFAEQILCRIKHIDYEYKKYKEEEDALAKKKVREKIPFE